MPCLSRPIFTPSFYSLIIKLRNYTWNVKCASKKKGVPIREAVLRSILSLSLPVRSPIDISYLIDNRTHRAEKGRCFFYGGNPSRCSCPILLIVVKSGLTHVEVNVISLHKKKSSRKPLTYTKPSSEFYRNCFVDLDPKCHNFGQEEPNTSGQIYRWWWYWSQL